MLTFIFRHPNNLNALHDELLAALPKVRPLMDQARMTVYGTEAEVTLIVPDDVTRAELETVVLAHNKTAADAAIAARAAQEQAQRTRLELLADKPALTAAERDELLQGIAKRHLRR